MAAAPPGVAGITWRPATDDDIPSIVDLARAVTDVEDLDEAGGPMFWDWWLGQHDREADTILAVDDAGTAQGLAGSYGTVTDTGTRAILWLDSHPNRLDLEPPLLAWAVDRGKEQVGGPPGPSRVVRISAEEHRTRRRRLLEDAGFVVARSFVKMMRSLSADLPDLGPGPDGVTVLPWTPNLDETARLASNAAFADHWGSLPMDPATWGSMVMDDEVVRRDLSFVAVSDGAAVAMCLGEVDPEEDALLLYVSRVGTIPEWRRRGLASLLLTHSLRAAAAAGLKHSALSVDEESRFDATAIYSGLGYRAMSRTIDYVLEDPS